MKDRVLRILAERPLLTLIGVMFLAYAGVQKARGNRLTDGFCMGNCSRGEISRTYLPEALEFKVAAPYEAMGKTRAAVHTFKLGPFETRRGTGFGYDRSVNNDFGQDGEYFYLPPDRLAFYHSTYVVPGAECPSTFMHQNARILILVGATPKISERLLAFQFKIEYGGTPFAYEGHAMTYDSSLADGELSQLRPAASVSAASNVGFAEIQYDYFLVTGFATPDLPLANPGKPVPAAVEW